MHYKFPLFISIFFSAEEECGHNWLFSKHGGVRHSSWLSEHAKTNDRPAWVVHKGIHRESIEFNLLASHETADQTVAPGPTDLHYIDQTVPCLYTLVFIKLDIMVTVQTQEFFRVCFGATKYWMNISVIFSQTDRPEKYTEAFYSLQKKCRWILSSKEQEGHYVDQRMPLLIEWV